MATTVTMENKGKKYFKDLQIGDAYLSFDNLLCPSIKISDDSCLYYDTENDYWARYEEDLNEIIVPLDMEIKFTYSQE